VKAAGVRHSARAIAEGVRQTPESAVEGGNQQALPPELVAILAQRGDGN